MKKIKSVYNLISYKFLSRRLKVTFFEKTKRESARKDVNNYISINDFREYCVFISTRSMEIQWNSEKRFVGGAIFYAIYDETTIISYGWGMKQTSSFLVEEIDVIISIPSDTIVLYDFYTHIKHRNLGNYANLLDCITNKEIHKFYLIYALNNNFSSKKGIMNAGFKNIGTYSHLHFKKSEMIKKYKLKRIPFYFNTRRLL